MCFSYIYSYLFFSGAYVYRSPKNLLTANVWSHLAIIANDSSVMFYVQGNPIAPAVSTPIYSHM